MTSKKYLGIEIGGTKLQLVLGDSKARIIERFRFVVDRVAGADGIRKHIVAFTYYLRASKVKTKCHAEFISAPHMIFTHDR